LAIGESDVDEGHRRLFSRHDNIPDMAATVNEFMISLVISLSS
jgi:hypothetical protein